jgi:hypothetical protein
MSGETLGMTAIIAAASVLALFIVVGLPLWLGIRHAYFERQLQHTEKMKALELGIATEPDRSGARWTPTGVCAAIGFWIPVIVFGSSLLASVLGGPAEMWHAAAGIGVTAIICGTLMMLRIQSRIPVQGPSAQGHNSFANAKPVGDPDAYDVAGRRG